MPAPDGGLASLAVPPVPRLAGRPTVADELRQRLADDILLGRLPPGAHLDEQGLADRYGVSRTPVREALKQLVVTGLVERRPRKGVAVAEVTPARLEAMFEAMAEIEAACLRHAVARMDDTERRLLLEVHLFSRDAVACGSADRYDGLNLEFHAIILRACRNPFLADTAGALRRRVQPFRRVQFRSAARLHRSFAEHQAIVDAVMARDAEAAYARMLAHVRAASTVAATFLPGAPDGG